MSACLHMLRPAVSTSASGKNIKTCKNTQTVIKRCKYKGLHIFFVCLFSIKELELVEASGEEQFLGSPEDVTRAGGLERTAASTLEKKH